MTPIVGPPSTSRDTAVAWARSRGAHDLFLHDIIPAIYQQSTLGVDPAVAVAVSAKECAFGRFGGTVPPEFYNPHGSKTTAGGSDTDPAAHQRFTSWEAGALALHAHLALYAGVISGERARELGDPRGFDYLHSNAKTVEALGGTYNANPDYGRSIVRDYLTPMQEATMSKERMPGAEWRPLPEAGAPDGYNKTQVIFHSIVGSAEGAYGYFLNSTSLESTFIVKKNGHIIQVMNGTDRADANGSANRRGISVETEDNFNPKIPGTGPDTDPWTDAQLDALYDIAMWAHAEHEVPLRRIPSEPEGGFGYHVMFGAPGPWTPSRGKTCPGTVRVRQFNEVLLPRILNRLPPKPAESEEDDDMKPYLAQAEGTPVFLIFPNGQAEAGVPTQAALDDARRIYGPTIEQVSKDFLRLHGVTV